MPGGAIGTLTNIAQINIPRWPNREANGRILAIDSLPSVSPNKLYDTAGGLIPERSAAQQQRVGINTDPAKRFLWLYEGDLKNIIINQLGKSSPNGLGSLSNGEMDTVASMIAGMNASIIIGDYEPANPSQDGWVWPSYQYPEKINYISQKVKEISQSGNNFKVFLDWFQTNNFTFGGKTLALSGDTWDASNGTRVDDYIAYFQNPQGATNFSDLSTMSKAGWGYTSITYQPDQAGASPDPATQSWGAIPSYLTSLCAINRINAYSPEKLILYVMWPREDFERLNNRNVRYKPKRLDGSIAPQGYYRATDSRLNYPFNLVADNTTVAYCNPKVSRLHAWIKPTSEDPYQTLKYADRNGSPACANNDGNGGRILGFETGNYTGTDAGSLPCPTGADYIGEEALGYSAILCGINRAAAHQDILDGSQVREAVAIQYKRQGQGSYTTIASITDLSEIAQAWKYKQPWAQVWRNPTNNKRIILYQDCFAPAYSVGEAILTINGNEYNLTTAANNAIDGNRLKMLRLD